MPYRHFITNTLAPDSDAVLRPASRPALTEARCCIKVYFPPYGFVSPGQIEGLVRLPAGSSQHKQRHNSEAKRTIQKSIEMPSTITCRRNVCVLSDKSACTSGINRFSIFSFILERSGAGIASLKPEWNKASAAREIFDVTKLPQIPIPMVPPIVRANWCEVVATPKLEMSMLFWTTTNVVRVTNPIPIPISKNTIKIVAIEV